VGGARAGWAWAGIGGNGSWWRLPAALGGGGGCQRRCLLLPWDACLCARFFSCVVSCLPYCAPPHALSLACPSHLPHIACSTCACPFASAPFLACLQISRLSLDHLVVTYTFVATLFGMAFQTPEDLGPSPPTSASAAAQPGPDFGVRAGGVVGWL